MQFLSHVKKRKGKLSFFQKNVSEKKLGGGQLSAAEKYLRASVTYWTMPTFIELKISLELRN